LFENVKEHRPALWQGNRLLTEGVPSASRTTSSAALGDDGRSRASSRTTLVTPGRLALLRDRLKQARLADSARTGGSSSCPP
jgi:hypothetical protein